MSSLLQLLKDIDGKLPSPPCCLTSPKLDAHNTIVYLTPSETIRAAEAGETVIISRNKLREIIAALSK